MSRSSAKEMKSSTEVVTTPIRFLTKEDLVSLFLSLPSAMLKIIFDESVLHRKFTFLSIRFKAFYSTLMLF